MNEQCGDVVSESELTAAVQALQAGRLIVFPTETVYGLAADPGNPAAMRALYQAKGRDFDKPVAYFISSLGQLDRFGVVVPAAAQSLAKQHLPGPLTLVLKGADAVYHGFRMPDHPLPLALLRCFGDVLAVTSANRSGGVDARTVDEARQELGDAVAVYLDGGPVQGTVPSTVVKVEPDGKMTVLRQGGLLIT